MIRPNPAGIAVVAWASLFKLPCKRAMPFIVRSCLASVLLSCLPIPTLAQSPRDGAPGRIRMGRLSVTPSFVLKDLGIDTNVFNTPDNRKLDFTFTIGPQVEALLDLRRVRVTVAGGTDYVHYTTYKSERSINRRLETGSEVQLGRRIVFFIGNSFLNTRERLNSEVDARARRIERSTGAGVTLGVSRKLQIGLSGLVSTRELDDAAVFRGVRLRETLNERSRTFSTSVTYRLSNLTTVGVTGTVSKNRFPFFPAKDHDSLELKLSSTFQPRALISGRASLGYLKSRPLSDLLPDFGGLVAGVDLFYALLERTELGLTIERGTETSFQPQTPYSVFNRYGGSVERQLFRRIDVFFATYRETRRYRGFASAGNPPSDDAGTNSLQRYLTDLGVRFARRARLSVVAEYAQRISSGPTARSYDGLRLGAMISYGLFNVGNRGDRGGFNP